MGIAFCSRMGSKWQLYCQSCFTELDRVDGEELMALQLKYLPIFCMDCDGGADEVSSVLLGDTSPYLLIVDNESEMLRRLKEAEKLQRGMREWTRKFRETVEKREASDAAER